MLLIFVEYFVLDDSVSRPIQDKFIFVVVVEIDHIFWKLQKQLMI